MSWFALWQIASSLIKDKTLGTVLLGPGHLLNRALMPAEKKARKEEEAIQWTPQTMQEEGIAIPQIYGTNRCHANLVGSYTVVPEYGVVKKGTDVTRCIKACFGAGPWAAEPDDSDLYVNGRPISDFTGMTAEWRLGTVAQTVLTDWSEHRQDYPIKQELIYGSPITWALQRTGFDDIEVIFEFPNGLIEYDSDGDPHSESLSLKIEVGDAIAGTWQTIMDDLVGGESVKVCYLSYLASGTYDGGTPFTFTRAMQPRIRVTLQTANSTSQRHIRDCNVYAVQVHRNTAFTHPGMVMLGLGLVPDAAVSGGVSELSCVSTGKIVQKTTGAFGLTRYHADVIRDILTQPVIQGDGGATAYSADYYRCLDPDLLVGSGWTAQRALADTVVPDMAGGTDALLRCDMVFDASTDCLSAVSEIAASGRCGLTWSGREAGLWVEESTDPCGILCDGTWLDGSGLFMPVSQEELASSGTVSYRDAADNYESRQIRFVDATFDTLAEANLSLAAETRDHGAARILRRELHRNWNVDSALQCMMDIDGIVYEAGDVLYAQIDGKSLGGRIIEVSADGRTITTDRDMTEVATGLDAVVVQVHHPQTGVQSVEMQSARLIAARTICVLEDWSTAPQAGDAFLFGPSSISGDLYQIDEIGIDEQLQISISATKYVQAVLDALDAIAPDHPVPLEE